MDGSVDACVTSRVHARAWTLPLLLVFTGCTICPDPFDYSGPVPNGSAPLNDFRARSGGIAPLGGVPRPWPPVVQADPDGAREPAAVVAAAPPATDGPDAAETSAAVEPVASVEPSADGAADHATEEGGPPQPVAAEPDLEEILPPTPPARPVIMPPLRETPGWRPRG